MKAAAPPARPDAAELFALYGNLIGAAVRASGCPRRLAADVRSVARVAFFQACTKWDPARPSRFPGYLKIRLRGAIADWRRHESRCKRQARGGPLAGSGVGVQLCAVAPGPDGRPTDLLATLPDLHAEDPREACSWGLADLRRAIACLPPRLQRVVRETHLAGRTTVALAPELGIAPSRVSQLRADALAALRALLEAPPWRPPAAAA